MNYFYRFAALALLAAPIATASSAGVPLPEVSAQNILAEITFLAGGALRGRASASPDEAIAAAYVASQFQSFGLRPAPGMSSYLQTVPLRRKVMSGDPVLTIGSAPVSGVSVVITAGGTLRGRAAIVSNPQGRVPHADVLVYTGPIEKLAMVRRNALGKAKLILAAEGDVTKRYLERNGGKPVLRTTLEGASADAGPVALATLPAAVLAKITPGTLVSLEVPVATVKASTTNVIAYLPGTDPKAGAILLSAHLDHLGVRPDGTVMPGANDDASGTVAVIELARYFATGSKPRRSILFVAYGSEEIGELGSSWFGDHPPVPLDSIITNIEFEMIAAQDPKLPKGALMMTGSERTTLFDLMKKNGAQVAPDPYHDQHFFERSDNYSIALKGVVAHTLSGWAEVPTYHQPTDTVANLDIPFMTRAINSLLSPLQVLASGEFKPEWKPGGRPKP